LIDIVELFDFQPIDPQLTEKAGTMTLSTASQTLTPSAAPLRAGRPGEYLAFKLDREDYGIDILCVQEIRSYEAPTRMANAPDFIKGVVNLRGVIVPIIDMRIKFGQPEPRYDHLTVVIVINVGNLVLGMVVDGVSDVVSLTADQLRPVPEMSASIISDHIQAIGDLQGRMLILLDIEALMTSAESGLVSPSVH
jgi:purine-binding chemotaxis protein CheW